MATAGVPYLEAIQNTLMGALCLRNFPSEKVERQEKPEIEMEDPRTAEEIEQKTYSNKP